MKTQRTICILILSAGLTAGCGSREKADQQPSSKPQKLAKVTKPELVEPAPAAPETSTPPPAAPAPAIQEEIKKTKAELKPSVPAPSPIEEEPESSLIAPYDPLGLQEPTTPPAETPAPKAIPIPAEIPPPEIPLMISPDNQLSIDNPKMNADDWSELAEKKHLKKLTLSGMPITEDNMVVLSSLSDLVVLEFSHAAVDPNGLSHLGALHSLKKLHLNDIQLNQDEIDRLHVALPNTDITASVAE